ncbi:zinc metalloproteinase nas-4-like [Penaeus japonicus]|uniref:zinc metalloproteinase nas-4-like n=1 Tax=Penaeus japonicus TaxID=27405 RepID=UPI001C70F07B|nr:zinc metalloproteinase nas-4-like [Penaeus japonicus]
MKVLTVLSTLLLVSATRAQVELPDITIGDPNDASNDLLGAPLSEKEFEESLELDLAAMQTDGDPITTSGFFQGDIMVASEDQLYQILEGDSSGQLSAIRNPQKVWPSGVIPYVISATYSSQERAVIARAMSEYHQKTCIRFVPRASHRDYVHILRGQGCSSAVGRSGGSQVVSLGHGCVQIGVVLHELMHAAGFWHEQSRSDRDNFVTINWSNIFPHLQFNFEKKTNAVTQDLGLSYDYDSVMHYGPYAFAMNRNYPTITPRRSGASIGQRNGFSQLDVQGLNLLYKCTGKPAPPTTCVDKHASCPSWAKAGYCKNNAVYMSANCKKSCNICGGSGCVDKGPYCTSWATKGECQRNPAYMSLMCKKACNLCGGAGGSCSNQSQHCQDWARKGECQRNPAYMNESCAKACGLC